jgi:Flp pilus assembly protein TadD
LIRKPKIDRNKNSAQHKEHAAMAQTQKKRAAYRLGAVGFVATIGAVSGGCAQLGSLPELTTATTEVRHKNIGGTPKNELAVATEYWGKKFAENPTKLESALSYAKNLKALGRKRQALAVLQQAAVYHGDKRELAGEYGRLALSLGHVKIAEKVLAQADSASDPDWRVISARGTALAKQGRYRDSVPFFERALVLAPNHPSVLNNLAMAQAMAGDAPQAEGLLRQAVAQGGNTKRVRQNLALVLGLQGRYDESASVGAQDQAPTAAAADTAALRKLVKLDPVIAPRASTNQYAKANGLKGSATAGSVAEGWNTQVAQAR